ncbi:hypothetical protein BDQ12DRAFT_691187 [Crucibulum laeve]|uniref:Uncharacterized protein n=1 Tax=Crucibulum laeve TaxID=68775 RepID=A0A5C3LJU7_9AGAR|nr:hypothetical protein BDQ12DRAFT_691187 [Crucibulum laeve]
MKGNFNSRLRVCTISIYNRDVKLIRILINAGSVIGLLASIVMPFIVTGKISDLPESCRKIRGCLVFHPRFQTGGC